MNLNKEVASLLQYDGTTLVRDQFNTHKLIVAATPNGKASVESTFPNYSNEISVSMIQAKITKLFAGVDDNVFNPTIPQVYGLDSRNGDVLWQLFVSSFSSFQNGRPLLHILRTTSHPPHPPLAILIGRSKVSTCSYTVHSAPIAWHCMTHVCQHVCQHVCVYFFQLQHVHLCVCEQLNHQPQLMYMCALAV